MNGSTREEVLTGGAVRQAGEVKRPLAFERVDRIHCRALSAPIWGVRADAAISGASIEVDEAVMHEAFDGVHWAVVMHDAKDTEQDDDDGRNDADGAAAVRGSGGGREGRADRHPVARL